MESTEKRCVDVVKQKMLKRQLTLSEIYDAVEKEQEYEGQDALDYLYDFALGISRHMIIRIDLSSGGPADWLEIKVYTDDKSHTIEEVEYHISDWFDHASVLVPVDTPLYRYAEETVELALYN
jgi:hypothetical protein